MHRWFAPRPLALSIVLAAVFLPGSTARREPATAPVVDDGITVYFSPQGGATAAVVEQIGKAEKTIQLQAYSFTSAPIAKALLDAHKRGVKVVAVLDASQRTAKYSGATFLQNAGIPVLIDDKHAIAHNKIILIDGKTVITGSFNLTKAAEQSNAENLLVIQDHPALAVAYARNFEKHRQHSTQYQGAKGGNSEPSEDAQELGEERPAAPSPAAAAAPITEPKAAADVVVHVTKNGKKYHREGCTSLAQSDLPMKLPDAKAKGYTPCARCKPVD